MHKSANCITYAINCVPTTDATGGLHKSANFTIYAINCELVSGVAEKLQKCNSAVSAGGLQKANVPGYAIKCVPTTDATGGLHKSANLGAYAINCVPILGYGRNAQKCKLYHLRN